VSDLSHVNQEVAGMFGKLRIIAVALAGAAGCGLISQAAPALAFGLGEAGDLEHARANARAGGPLSEHDAELLERYGCLSGTNHPLCDRLSGRNERQHRNTRKHRHHIERY
jgi:hypothetical protein